MNLRKWINLKLKRANKSLKQKFIDCTNGRIVSGLERMRERIRELKSGGE